MWKAAQPAITSFPFHHVDPGNRTQAVQGWWQVPKLSSWPYTKFLQVTQLSQAPLQVWIMEACVERSSGLTLERRWDL